MRPVFSGCIYMVCSFRGNAQRQASSWRGNWSMLLLLIGVTGLGSLVYFTWTDDFKHTLVSRGEILTQPRVFTVDCSEDYKKHKLFPGMLVVLLPLTELHPLKVQTALQTLLEISALVLVCISGFYQFNMQ